MPGIPGPDRGRHRCARRQGCRRGLGRDERAHGHRAGAALRGRGRCRHRLHRHRPRRRAAGPQSAGHGRACARHVDPGDRLGRPRRHRGCARAAAAGVCYACKVSSRAARSTTAGSMPGRRWHCFRDLADEQSRLFRSSPRAVRRHPDGARGILAVGSQLDRHSLQVRAVQRAGEPHDDPRVSGALASDSRTSSASCCGSWIGALRGGSRRVRRQDGIGVRYPDVVVDRVSSGLEDLRV